MLSQGTRRTGAEGGGHRDDILQREGTQNNRALQVITAAAIENTHKTEQYKT